MSGFVDSPVQHDYLLKMLAHSAPASETHIGLSMAASTALKQRNILFFSAEVSGPRR